MEHGNVKYCFKFQSDSINTVVANIMKLSGTTLNSNLILLIQAYPAFQKHCRKSFKFQSDSINTGILTASVTTVSGFKFQSDSINTSAYNQRWHVY